MMHNTLNKIKQKEQIKNLSRDIARNRPFRTLYFMYLEQDFHEIGGLAVYDVVCTFDFAMSLSGNITR